MFKECSSGVGTPNHGELKRRFLSLVKSRLYKLNSFSDFQVYNCRCLQKFAMKIDFHIAVFWPKSNTSTSLHFTKNAGSDTTWQHYKLSKARQNSQSNTCFWETSKTTLMKTKMVSEVVMGRKHVFFSSLDSRQHCSIFC
jgi:hypothetical protein